MHENDMKYDIDEESERVFEPVFSSEFLMNKELFYDFSSVSYHRTKRGFIVFLCLVAFAITINILVGNYELVVLFGPLMALLMSLVYFRTNKAIRVNYERNVLAGGNNTVFKYDLLKDKIVSLVGGRKTEYDYNQITNLFETKDFILLHLKYNLHITINKNTLDGDVEDLKRFLLSKCVGVKKKRFINCENDKKISVVFLISLIAVAVAGSVIGVLF